MLWALSLDNTNKFKNITFTASAQPGVFYGAVMQTGTLLGFFAKSTIVIATMNLAGM